MSTLIVERSQNISILRVPNREEALELLTSGFVHQNPHVRLFFLMKEKQWPLARQLWETMEKNICLNTGIPADYI